MNVPLYTVTWNRREEIVDKLLGKLEEWGASHLFGNVEYEVDELRRDEQVVRKVIEARTNRREGWKGEVAFLKDLCVVAPGEIVTKVRRRLCPLRKGSFNSFTLFPSQQDKPYSVFSPWYKNWAATVSASPLRYLGDAGSLSPNDPSARQHPILLPMFAHQIPKYLEGWKLDHEDQKRMEHLWPVGEGICDQVRLSRRASRRVDRR